MNQVDLVALEALEPAVYNPRETDPHRLKLLRLSLRKLGFILPLYANHGGHLLSGHQRLLSSELNGLLHVPVVRIDVQEKYLRNLNLIFNRATNDMRSDDTSDKLLNSLDLDQLQALADSVPDKDPSKPEEMYRAAFAKLEPIEELMKLKLAPYEGAAVGMAQQLMLHKIFMPIIVNADTDEVINGSYRLYAAADEQSRWKYEAHLAKGVFPVVRITDAEAKLARVLINMISMRFTLEKQYADQLRFGSFRRANNRVEDLVRALRIWPDKGRLKSAAESLKDPELFWGNFRKEVGESVLDFGAGQRLNERILVQKGIRTCSWEPYPVPQTFDPERELAEAESRAHKPDIHLCRRITDEFLQRVASGETFDAILISAVLNSVPFEVDRRYVLLICNALSSFHTRLIGSVRHVRKKEEFSKQVDNRMNANGTTAVLQSMFTLDYEPNLTLGDISVMPKVQRFHTMPEADHLLKLFYMKTELKDGGGYIYFRATAPRRVSPKHLKKALLAEFNLPYDEETRIDRGQQALEAFGQRLKINFSEVPDV